MQNGAWPRRSLPFQVLAAILMVAAATAFTTVLKLFAPQFTFGIYYAAVIIAAYYVGIRAGVLTAFVAGLIGNFLFVHGGQGLLATPGEVLQLATFWAVCAVICGLIYMSRRNEQRLRDRERFIQNLAATAPYTLYLYDVPADQVDYVTADAAGLDDAGNERAVGHDEKPVRSVRQIRNTCILMTASATTST